MQTRTSGRLGGKAVLITGGGSGIGEAAALAFAAEGARVALVGRRQAELDRVAGTITSAGGTALALPGDVTDEATVCELIIGDTIVAKPTYHR